MRLLIISDSHGRHEIADRIIGENKDAEHIFFLGDKTEDIEYCLSYRKGKLRYVFEISEL